jgi:hemoglobin/transferrin/lactoferrin receptor protein
MKRIILLFISFITIKGQQLMAQQDTSKTKELSEVVISASKFEERKKRVAQSTVNVLALKKNQLLNVSSSADLLQNSGAVLVQKSQQGGGSPMIRGFEASRILLMVDGVRLNNAIYRTGHLQNVITIDPYMLEKAEILFGPGSTLYGSDALGGVVYMQSKNPILSTNNNTLVKGNAVLNYASANKQQTGHVDVNFANKRWGFLTSFTYNDFSDLKQGTERSSQYPTFGLRPWYVERINGVDSMVSNSDPNVQKFSGYSQWDLGQKILFQPRSNESHVLNIQLSNSSNIPRYDRLTESNAGIPAQAEWYYGPQKRSFFSYQFNAKKLNGFFDQARIIASFQNTEESRYTRGYRAANRTERVERVDVYGFTADAKKNVGAHEYTAGVDVQLNFVRSRARRVNVNSGVISAANTRYPDGFNGMQLVAFYINHLWKLNDQLTLSEGIRLNKAFLYSTFTNKLPINFPFSEARQNNTALTGNIGLIFSPNDDLKTSVFINSGFRSPNVDDLGKVFDTRQGMVVVPNPDIKPEYTYNFEWNIEKYFNFGNKNRAGIGAAAYYTLFRNAIILDAFKLNGQDSIIYDGVKSQVVANQNKAKAYIYGFETWAFARFAQHFEVNGRITYTKGNYTSYSNTIPLDHIAPLFGKAALKYDNDKLSAETWVLFNGWKKIKDYNPFGEDNQQYATVDGMPSWYTINLRLGYQVMKNAVLQLSVENLLDRNYRIFASGISAAGRNFIVTARLSF